MKKVRKRLPKMRKSLRDEYLVQEYLNSIQFRCTPSTVASKKGILKQFIRFFNKPLVKVNSGDIRRFTGSLVRRKLKKKTILNYIDTIRAFKGFLAGFYSLLDYRRKVPETFKSRPLSREEVKELIKAEKSVRDKLLIALLYDTGLRTSELADLKLDDVDPKTGLVKVVGIKSRRVKYNKEHLGALVDLWLRKGRKSYSNARRTDYFFVSRTGRKLSQKAMCEIVRKAAERAGIGRPIYRVSPHVLRHTFAAHAIEDGVKLKDIQRMLGHSSKETSRSFSKVTRRKKAKGGEKS